MKQAIFLGLSVLLVLFVGWLAWTSALPEQRQGSATRFVQAPPAVVLATLLNAKEQTRWRPDVKRVDVTANGRSWTEYKSDGDVLQFSLELQTESEVRLRFSSQRGYSGDWHGLVQAEGGGSRVTVTETVRVPGLIARTLSQLFFQPGQFAQQYLLLLADEAKEQAATAAGGGAR